ncbi:hypothetical protein Y1Q_0017352 [Alligator mississippiensis]|uniref:Uncharacterized protein n=1 Tax=Alligator mississippiensis TaxID=8496 RepID=A0A151NGD6_ALLMI|nr:hypothetical protein Y1Q_0017352 [Alligator mississippiensis]
MANEVTYSAVTIVARERERISPPASDPGNAVTYAEVYRHQKPEEGNPTDTPASGPSSRHSGWMYVSIVLGILSLILLTSITVLSYRSLSGSTYSSESPSKLSTNSVGDCTCPRENRTGKSIEQEEGCGTGRVANPPGLTGISIDLLVTIESNPGD